MPEISEPEWGKRAIDMIAILAAIADWLRHELLLFAAVGIAVGGLDDLAIDLIFLTRRYWRRARIYSRHPRTTARTLPRSRASGQMAIFVPAWDESAVIGAMLNRTLSAWRGESFTLFVGCYPNDAATCDIVAAFAERNANVVLVILDHPGPTTKADCLNGLWRAMNRDEEDCARRFKAVVLHDAEDVVHPDALHIFDFLLDRFDMVQLPVLPLIDPKSRWISGHYCDEFAETHGKLLSVREALGAAMPSAGVGCAFRRARVAQIAALHGDRPFDPDCLTEDYELGLRIGELAGRGIFVRMRDAAGNLVCTREYFPSRLYDAVRQKARWTVGIALAGWDRIGWSGNIFERWMRLRDRRAPLAALVLTAAYAGGLLYAFALLLRLAGLGPAPVVDPILFGLLSINGVLLLWRLAFRCACVTHHYGWREGLRALPRSFIANMIAIMAARRAVAIYFRIWRGAAPHWEKTQHRFPTDLESPT